MRIESVLELQAEVLSKIFGFVEGLVAADVAGPPAQHYLDPFLIERRPRSYRSEKRRAAEDIALGVVARQPAEARLAVLVQDRRKVRSTAVEEIVSLARGEAEVVYIGRQQPLWTSLRNDPIRLGSSISPTTVHYAGTLGCFCRDDSTGQVAVLSNNHVLANVNKMARSTPIMQPGAGDGGDPDADRIAALSRFVPLLHDGAPNAVDAAIAALSRHGRSEDRHTLYRGAETPRPAMTLRPERLAEVLPGAAVFKTGRTTGFTGGRVRAVNVSNFLVDMGEGLARFDDQIVIEMDMTPLQPFGRPGDSGSLIVDEVGQPVALLFSGSASGGAGNLGITGANPISSVVGQLGVTLI
ncbi:MAG TPA: hypothetical protein VK035_11545 [Kiloniellales bacterium]|nr:hypothetical protein [Kiloniellales bacterium]